MLWRLCRLAVSDKILDLHPSNTSSLYDINEVTLELHPGVLELPCDTHPVVSLKTEYHH